jgi:uncharacterized repeat protein (TIGR01451 family)
MAGKPARWLLALASMALALAATGVHAQAADLGVSKSGPETATADSDVVYTVTVVNGGPDVAQAVTFSDPVPAGMTYVSVTQTGTPFLCAEPATPGGTLTCTVATLAVGAPTTFTVTLHIPALTPDGTAFTNIASIASTTFDPNDENDASAAGTLIPALAMADLSVTKTAAPGAAADIDVPFTIDVFNPGPDAAAVATLSDPLPAGMTFVSLAQTSGPAFICTIPAVGDNGTVTCSIPSLPANTHAIFTLVAHVPAGASFGELFTNIVTASSDTFDQNTENQQGVATVRIASADLAVTKAGPASVDASTPYSYTLTISNTGPDPASNAALTDPLPAQVTFVSLTQDSGTPVACSTPAVGSEGTVACSFGNMAPGTSAQFTLNVVAGRTSTIVNTATATSDSYDPNTENNSATSTAAVILPPPPPFVTAVPVPMSSHLLLVMLGLALSVAAWRNLRQHRSGMRRID